MMILQEIHLIHYLPLIEIKQCIALIDKRPFFDHPVKNRQEAYEKLVAMSRNNDYATGNVLDFSFAQSYYQRIGIDLSRQKKYKYSSTY